MLPDVEILLPSTLSRTLAIPRVRDMLKLRDVEEEIILYLPLKHRSQSLFGVSFSWEVAITPAMASVHEEVAISNPIVKLEEVAVSNCNRSSQEELSGYCYMLENGVCLDNFVVPNALKAYGASHCVSVGRVIHGCALKVGFGGCVYVASSLVDDMYGKCGLLSDAQKVFDKMSERNVVAWNVRNRRTEQDDKFGSEGYCINQQFGLRLKERLLLLLFCLGRYTCYKYVSR